MGANSQSTVVDLWALIDKKSGQVAFSGNAPMLYWTRKEAWYDSDDSMVPRKVTVTITRKRK